MQTSLLTAGKRPAANRPIAWLSTMLACLCLPLSGVSAQSVKPVDPPAVNTPGNPGAVPVSPVSTALTDQNVDNRWPMRFTIEQGELTLYQPQLTDFDENRMTSRAAVSLQRPSEETPLFGAIWLESRVMTDRAARTVEVVDVNVTRLRFPDIEDDIQLQSLSQALTTAFRQRPMVLSLDQMLSMLETVRKDEQAVSELKVEPPQILFTNEPAVLVQYDGQPRVTQSVDQRLMRVVNTPFFVVLDTATKRYYLKGAGKWYAALAATGPFQPITAAPDYVGNLATSSGYVDPEQDMADDAANDITPITPRIVTATEPTELIWTDGNQELTPIPSTSLLYVANTESDVFLDINTQKVYVLLAGRWYTATRNTGPWGYVAPDQLPADFARIPVNSPKGAVLAHVAGTQMARDALADNYVPQTAAIDRTNYQQPVIEYDGTPQFEPVESTRITYAVNTPNAVLRVQGRYYTCYNAVWYVSNSPTGYWDLCTTVPREVYLIPPTSPVYSVRYVRVYEVTPSVVYVGYLPGYIGSYVHHGVVVYGTGYHYRPWVGRVYYPRPYTYGFSPRYDPYRSYWGLGVGINFGSGVSLWFGNTYRYEPRRSVWFGYGGYRPIYYSRHYRYYRPNYPHVVRHGQHWNDRRDWNDRGWHDRDRDGRDYRGDRDRYDRRSDWRPRREDYNIYERRQDVTRVTTVRSPATRDVNRDRNRIYRDVNEDRSRIVDGVNEDRRRIVRDADRAIEGSIDRNFPREERGDRAGGDRDARDDNGRDGGRYDGRADRDDRNDRARVSPQNPGADRTADRNNDRNTPERNVIRGRDPQAGNNVYADQQGNIYRRNGDNWERRDRNQWVPDRAGPTTTSTPAPSQPAVVERDRGNTSRGDAPTGNRGDIRGSLPEQGNSSRYPNRGAQQDIRTQREVTPTQPRVNDQPRMIVTPRNPTPDVQTYTPADRGQDRNLDRNADRNVNRDAVRGVDRSRSQVVTPEASTRSRLDIPSSAERYQNQLDADYRARVLGQQRQQIYGESRGVDAQPRVVTPQTRVQREASPARETAPAREAVPARQASPAREAAPSRQAAPARESSPAPQREVAPSRQREASPARESSSGSSSRYQGRDGGESRPGGRASDRGK